MKKLTEFEKEMMIRGFTKATIKSYTYYQQRFLMYARKSSRQANSQDIKNFLSYLVTRGAKPRTINLALAALKFYFYTFSNKRLFSKIKTSKQEKKIYDILTKEQIQNMINVCTNLKHKLIIMLLYSSGLRVNECCTMKIDDIDMNKHSAIVRLGKGKKDRFVLLSDTFCRLLRSFINKNNIVTGYIFQGPYGHLSPRSIQSILTQNAKKAGIKKRVYPHLLRACFATHLLEHGQDIYSVKRAMGHSKVQTTEGYIGHSSKQMDLPISPMDT